jgi:hypothetical protein
MVACFDFEFTHSAMLFVRGFWNVNVVGASAAGYKRAGGNEFAGSESGGSPGQGAVPSPDES